MPLLFRKARRKIAELDAHDVAHRISAYTYGNFLVLAALLSIHDANAIFDGTAILYITGTGLTTYIAHVISEMQEYRVLHGGTPPRDFVKHALGNASPILGTTVYPVALLILATFLPPGGTYDIIFDCTIILCLVTVVWRIFSLNFAIARYRGEPLCWRTFRSAVWLTFAVIVLAIVKIMFTHAGKSPQSSPEAQINRDQGSFCMHHRWDAPGHMLEQRYTLGRGYRLEPQLDATSVRPGPSNRRSTNTTRRAPLQCREPCTGSK